MSPGCEEADRAGPSHRICLRSRKPHCGMFDEANAHRQRALRRDRALQQADERADRPI